MVLPYQDSHGDFLEQGDVLERTAALDDLLQDVHPTYAKSDSNTHFIILTQSCDLVQRKGAPCKARYLTLAVVRPLDDVFVRELDKSTRNKISVGVRISTDRERTRLDAFLERLHNNNEAGYFFLIARPDKRFPIDACAFLRLSIAIKATEHYGTCLSAKILQLTEPFQAKLGWLVGQMYSRVGTEEWERKALMKRIKTLTSSAAIWLDERRLKALEQRVGDGLPHLTEDQLMDEIKKLPSRKSEVADRIQEITAHFEPIARAVKDGAISKTDLNDLNNLIKSDQQIKALIRN